jgi:TM2 domain-containing membrane protein YozV
MLGRLCCVIALCLFSCFSLSARVTERDVTHNKAILLSQPPLAIGANFAIDSIPHRKHKLIAAVLAFPLGIFGLHRIYLGAAKATPLIYIATFGGLFGVLPFIDFTLILLCKDVNIYANNPHTFMWSKKGNKK